MDKEEVKAAVKEAIKEERKSFHIDSERHYNHHKFIEWLMDLSKGATGIFGKTVMGAIGLAIITFIALGFIVWGKSAFKGP